jgi:hypothetical protein
VRIKCSRGEHIAGVTDQRGNVTPLNKFRRHADVRHTEPPLFQATVGRNGRECHQPPGENTLRCRMTTREVTEMSTSRDRMKRRQRVFAALTALTLILSLFGGLFGRS